MSTAAASLIARRDAICAELAAITASSAGGKPNSSGGGDMVHVDHQGYRQSLYAELREINQMLSAIEGPTIIETVGEM